MREWFVACLAAASVAALAMALAPAASAAPQTVPNGPWVEDSQHVSLERLHNYEELVKALRQIERNSQGRVSLDVVGQSNEGRDLYLASVGTGDTRLLYVTQQHGDEPLGTEAALQLLQRLGSSNNPEVRAWLSEVTLLVMPRVNPDGAERPWRYNVDAACTGDIYGGQYCRQGQGFDINRYHAPSLTPATNPVPEAAAVRGVFDTYQPDLVVDFHHQGSYVDSNGEMITTSVYWPIATGVAPGPVNLSKQTTVVIDQTLSHYGFATVSQYPGGSFEGIFRNAYGLLGAGSVLVELRGDIGQKSAGKLVRTAYVTMFSVLEAAAEGSLYDVDPALADQIPERGPGVDDPSE